MVQYKIVIGINKFVTCQYFKLNLLIECTLYNKIGNVQIL